MRQVELPCRFVWEYFVRDVKRKKMLRGASVLNLVVIGIDQLADAVSGDEVSVAREHSTPVAIELVFNGEADLSRGFLLFGTLKDGEVGLGKKPVRGDICTNERVKLA